MNQSANNSRATPAESWFVATEKGAVEYSLETLKNEIACSNVHSGSLVWRKGMQDWVQLDQVPLLRMLASVQPRKEVGRPADFAPIAAPVATGQVDEQFDDETTLFRPPSMGGAETSADQDRSGSFQPSVLTKCAAETPVADQPTAIFDGLFDTPDYAAASADVQLSAAAAEETPANPGRALNVGEPALKSDTPKQAESAAPVDPPEPSKAEATATINDAQQKGGRAPARRHKPPSVPRKQKSDRPQPTRPVLARPTTPRVSIAAISSRAIESRPSFQLPKREPIPEGFAPRAPMKTGATPLAGLARTPTVVAMPQSAPPTELSSVRVELPIASPGARHTAPAILAPIILPVPMPALPPPPPRVEPSKDTRSDAHSCAADQTELASAPVPENQKPATVARAGDRSSPESSGSAAAVDVPGALTETQSQGDGTRSPAIQAVPPVHAEQLERWFDRAPLADIAEGDSLFPSSSSVHPGLFKANRSRRAILLLAACGVAAAATFGIVAAVSSPDVVSTPHSAADNLREQPSPTQPTTSAASGQKQAPSNSAREPAPVVADDVQRKDSEQRPATRAGVVAARDSIEATRPPSSPAVRRKTVPTAGAVAIAHSEPPESGHPAADESQAWERGTIEKRAWMQPGF